MQGSEALTSADSRHYRFAFRLQSSSDLPADFPVPVPSEQWCYAIFVPGDTSDRWFKPRYPPRVYILTDESIRIFDHPALGGSSYTCLLNDLVEMTCYRALLHGELEFHSERSHSGRLLYGAIQHHCMDPFLKDLRFRWLQRREGAESLGRRSLLHRTDSRCLGAVYRELDTDERLEHVAFQHAFLRRTPSRLFALKEEIAARALVRTDSRLVIAIEGMGNLQEPYGVRLRSASLHFPPMVTRREERQRTLYQINFGKQVNWNFWALPEETVLVDRLIYC